MFEKELKAAFLQHDISMTATLLDPFCLILLLGSEEEKRWKKIEPILLSALNKFTSDGTLGGYFVSNGTRGSGKEEILRSYHEAKRGSESAFPGLDGEKVCALKKCRRNFPGNRSGNRMVKNSWMFFIIC